MSNGRLPATVLAPIPGGRLRKDAAAAWNAMCERARQQHRPVPRPVGPVSSYRDYDAQEHFWRLYQSGRGNPAARPGTSNHGWGVAVDALAAGWPTLRVLAPRYAFTNVEGARVGEAWHWSNPGGAGARFPRIKPRDPLLALTPAERRRAKQVTALRRRARPGNLPRRVHLKAWLVRARKRVWRAGQRKGWTAARRERYAVLCRLTK